MDMDVAGLDTPVGPLSVQVSDAGLARIGWVRDGRPPVSGTPRDVAPVLEQLRAYFDGELREFDLPLDWTFARGTRLAVLQALYKGVAYGESVTYGELAERSGTGAPARAIGGIMGSNPLPIVVPCHRVLAHDGLGGYSGGNGATGQDGLEVKRWLLTMEGVLPPTLDWDPAGL
ncbi:MAG: methylated-DNA--[protein]-cysteine S-methyltransferase [Thermocrispum sp.]